MQTVRRNVVVAACLAAGLGVVATPATAAIFKVGTGSSCTHSSIQAAVNAAASSAGPDVVRIARSLSYTDQHVTIGGQELQLEGGFASCQSASADTTPTTVSGAGAFQGSVFTVSGPGNVIFADLDIVSGDPAGDGGGIAIINTGRLQTRVSLRKVRVLENSAVNGAGISIKGQPRDQTAVQLELGADSIVQSNHATRDGGGIFCRNATVQVTGTRSRVVANYADRGGGVHADACATTITSGGYAPYFGAIAFNNATRYGGGLSIYGSTSRAQVITTNGKVPAAIQYNSAGTFGGGAYLLDSSLQVAEGIVEGNVAPEGGGVYLASQQVLPIIGMVMFEPGGGALGAARCVPPQSCNRISGNRARFADGRDGDGAAIMVRMRFYDQQNTVAHTHLAGTLVNDNIGASLLYTDAQVFGGGVGNAIHDLGIDAAVITGNVVSGSLVDHFTHLTDHDPLKIRSTSIGGNQVGYYVLTSSQPMDVSHSIVWQPGAVAFFTDQGHLYPSRVRYTIASDFNQIFPAADLLIADPRFQDAAAGDLRLGDPSPAIDYAPDSGIGLTRDGAPRPVGLPAYPDRFGKEDLGAYERQF